MDAVDSVRAKIYSLLLVINGAIPLQVRRQALTVCICSRAILCIGFPDLALSSRCCTPRTVVDSRWPILLVAAHCRPAATKAVSLGSDELSFNRAVQCKIRSKSVPLERRGRPSESGHGQEEHAAEERWDCACLAQWASATTYIHSAVPGCREC